MKYMSYWIRDSNSLKHVRNSLLIMVNCWKITAVLLQSKQSKLWGEWPSGPASSISLTEVKHGCVRLETGWATFQMNDQNSSLSRPSEGTLN